MKNEPLLHYFQAISLVDKLEAEKQASKELKIAMKTASPFYVDYNFFNQLVKFDDIMEKYQFSEDREGDVMEYILSHLEEVDLTEIKMPFQYMYFGFDNIDQELEDVQLKATIPAGVLVTRSNVYLQLTKKLAPAKYLTIFASIVENGVFRIDNDYESSIAAHFAYFRFIKRLIALIEYINHCGTIIMEDMTMFSNKRIAQNITKKLRIKKPIPKAFYKVIVQHCIIDEKPKQGEGQWKLSYRFGVRGHNVTRLMSGDLPIDPKVEKYLMKDVRRKIIRTASDIDEETTKILLERNIKYIEGTWLSVLVIWRHSFIKGPKDAPFVKSVHKVQ